MTNIPLRDQVAETLKDASWADWWDPEAGQVAEIPVSDATEAVMKVIEQRISDCWPDPFGNWSAEQADAAKAIKERVLQALREPSA